ATTAAWVADKLRVGHQAAAAMVRLAGALDGPVQQPGAALAAGEVTVEQATVIAGAIGRLPEATRRAGETHLLGLAQQFSPPQLRKLAVRLEETVDPDGAEARHREMFARRERRDAECGITLSRLDGDELWQIRGRMNAETAAIIRAAIDPLCSPRRHRD